MRKNTRKRSNPLISKSIICFLQFILSFILGAIITVICFALMEKLYNIIYGKGDTYIEYCLKYGF